MDEGDDFAGHVRLRLESLTGQSEESVSRDDSSAEDRYQIETLLGEGAVGRVWKAYDRTLKRHVALKKLRADGAGSRERFLREARNQARVQNPNICKVFDLGETKGEPYIAMHYVDGPILSAAATRMTIREKAEVMQTVASAIHAAHQCGLIHRDLKPGNILVEKTDQRWIPYITDFGLAREQDAVDGTKTGMVVGTPAYMSPEQARGAIREIDPRTDVYALGATFYEILCGHPPFEGASMEIALKILQEDAPALRKQNPEIPADLEMIVMKCLEKEPVRRYYTAQALADDLSRYLNGEPIVARPATWHYRVSKMMRRHRRMAAVVALASLAVLLSASFGVYNWWMSAQRAELAQQFGQEVAEIEGFLRYASTLPIHDIRKEKLLAREKMKRIEQRMQELGGPAVLPGNFALGRGYLALQEHEKARRHLELAWNGGYRSPEIAYALGRTMGALYQKELQSLEGTSNKELKEGRRREIEKQFRDPAMNYLNASRGSTMAPSHYLEALIAFYAGRYDDAAKSNAEAIKSEPWSSEPLKLRGDIFVLQAMQQDQTGDLKNAAVNYTKAGDSYKAALDISRSDASIYQAECRRLMEWQGLIDFHEVPTETVYAQAAGACERAIQIEPDNPAFYSELAQLYCDWATTKRLTRMEPELLFQKAIQTAQKALEIDRDFPEAWTSLGSSYVNLALRQWDTGADRIPTINLALKAFANRIRLKPDPQSYSDLGDAYSDRGAVEMETGIDPIQSLDASVEAYQNAIKLKPGLARFRNNLGITYMRKGRYELQHGMNPTNSLQAANKNYRKAVEINSKYMWAYNNLGISLTALAQYEIMQSRNPVALFNDAIQSYSTAIELDPSLSYLNLARACVAKAEYSVQLGQDPATDLDHARQSLSSFMNQSGNILGAKRDLASIELVAASWAILQGNSPNAFLETAESSLRDALSHNPEDPESFRQYAKHCLLSAKYKLRLRRDYSPDINKGLEKIAEALKRDPQSAESYAIQAELQSFNRPVEARKSLMKAFELNQNLRNKYAPLVAELDKHAME